MSLRKRLLRIALALFIVLGFGGYFLFQLAFFNPLEGGYEYDVSTLAPRDVDFFVAKAKLADDFGEFPELRIGEQVADSSAWRAWKRSPEYREFDQAYAYEDTLAQLYALPDQLAGLDPLSIFGGQDIAIAGYFRGPDLAQADWAVYGRVSFLGKLAVASLAHPGLIGLEDQGLAAVVDGDVVTLSGGQLARELHVGRVRDVAVLGTSLELVKAATDLEARGGENSFGQGATYFDHIQNARRSLEGNEVELFIDWRAYSENMRLTGRWPDPQSIDYFPAFLGRLFQMGSVKSAVGVMGFDHGITLDLHGELSSELMTAAQKRIYRERGVERSWFMSNPAQIARADSGLFLYMEIDVGDLLRLMLEAAEGALRSNVEDLVRGTGQYESVDQLIDELDGIFQGRVALIVRDNDYPAREDDPPHNGVPVPAVGVVLWTDGSTEAQKRIDRLHDVITENQGRLGLEGRLGSGGVFKNPLRTGHEVWEFWTQFVDGTGHIATGIDGRRYFISNSYSMIEDMIRVYNEGGRGSERLSERPDFRELVREGLAHANAVLWVNPRTLERVTGKFAQYDAEREVLENIVWENERAREEDEVLREQFPGKQRGRLDDATQAAVNDLVNPRLEALRMRLLEEQVPQIRARMERTARYRAAVSGMLVMLALDPKHYQLTLSALIPLDQ